jgi:hypothetical protein
VRALLDASRTRGTTKWLIGSVTNARVEQIARRLINLEHPND